MSVWELSKLLDSFSTRRASIGFDLHFLTLSSEHLKLIVFGRSLWLDSHVCAWFIDGDRVRSPTFCKRQLRYNWHRAKHHKDEGLEQWLAKQISLVQDLLKVAVTFRKSIYDSMQGHQPTDSAGLRHMWLRVLAILAESNSHLCRRNSSNANWKCTGLCLGPFSDKIRAFLANAGVVWSRNSRGLDSEKDSYVFHQRTVRSGDQWPCSLTHFARGGAKIRRKGHCAPMHCQLALMDNDVQSCMCKELGFIQDTLYKGKTSDSLQQCSIPKFHVCSTNVFDQWYRVRRG